MIVTKINTVRLEKKRNLQIIQIQDC